MSVQIVEFLHLNGGCCWMQLHWKTLLPSKDIVTIIEECIRASPAASSKPPCTDEVQQSHPVCHWKTPVGHGKYTSSLVPGKPRKSLTNMI